VLADEGGLSLLVLSVPKDSASQKAAATGAFVARGAFARNPRYQLLDLEAFLDQSSEIAGRSAITKALQALEKGSHALDELEVDTAVGSLNEAVVNFERGAGYLEDIKPYVDALLKLGAAYALNAEKDNARESFKRALIIDRSASLEKLPDQARKFFEEAGKKVDDTERGPLNVFTTPAAGEVYIDGVFRGPAPTVVEGLRKGTHLVRVVRPGHRSDGRAVKVSSSSEETLNFTLKPALKTAELEGLSARIHPDVVSGQGPTLTELTRFAKVDQAFVMSVTSSATDVRVTAVLVDGTGHPLQSSQKTFTGDRYRQELDEWMESGFRSAQTGTTEAVNKDISTNTNTNYKAPTGGGGSPGKGKVIGGVLLLPGAPLAGLVAVLITAGALFSAYLWLGYPIPLPADGGVALKPLIRATNINGILVTNALWLILPAFALFFFVGSLLTIAGGVVLIVLGNNEKQSMDDILAGGGGDTAAVAPGGGQ